MSYRSLRIRSFQSTERSALLVPKWYFTNPYPTRNHATSGPGGLRNVGIALDPKGLGNISRDSEDEISESRVNHELLPVPDESNQAAGESSQSEPFISSTQPAFHATYSSDGGSQTLLLPEAPEDWGPRGYHGEPFNGRRRKILQAAFIAATSNRLHRRSQIISRVVRSEAKLKALEELLYPYRHRHPNWERNLYALFRFRQYNRCDESQILGFRISPFADEWIEDLYKDGYTIKVTEGWEQLSAQQKEVHELSADLSKDGHIQKAAKRWRRLPLWQQRIRWPHIMLKCLTVSTEQALDFLLLTNCRPLPPFESVMDVLLLLKITRGGEINSSPGLGDRYQHILSQQRQPTRWIYHMERKHLDLLLEECSGDEGIRLFEELLHADIHISYHCMLIFMDFFTRMGDVDLALKALNGIDLDLRLQSDKQLLSRCTNLLKLDSITSDGASPNFRILPQILEAGVKTNLVLHNMILKNAVNLGASVVAWDLFRYLRDHDLPTDARTYIVLMQDALARRDTEGLQELLTAINTRNDLLDDPYLIACTLTLIRVHGRESRLRPSLVYSNMLEVYSRAFSIAPLKHLMMLSESTWSIPNPNQVEPDIDTLAFVVQSYVLAQHSSKVVQSLLDWTEHLWSGGDELVLALARCLAFYDGFIAFYARRSENLPKCLQIVQLMLDRKVQPSATTWGILALAFARHGQSQAAEEVKNMMERKGLHLEGKTTRLMREFPPYRDRGVSASAEEVLVNRPKGIPLAGQSPLADAKLKSQFAEQEFVDVVDDTTPSAELHHRSVPESQRSSSLDISDGSSLQDLDTDYTEDITQLQEKHSAQISPGQRQGQITDERSHNLRDLDNHKDAPVPNSLIVESFQRAVIRRIDEDQLDLLLLDSSPVTLSNGSHVQPGIPPVPDVLHQLAATSESTPAYKESSFDGLFHNTLPDQCPKATDHTSLVPPSASGPGSTGLTFGSGDEVISDRARTTEAQHVQERVAEGRMSREPDEEDAECGLYDDQRRAAGGKQFKETPSKEIEALQTEDKESNAKEVRNRAPKGRGSKKPATEPRRSRRARRKYLPFVHSPGAILDNLENARLSLAKSSSIKSRSMETVGHGDGTRSPEAGAAGEADRVEPIALAAEEVRAASKREERQS